MGFEGVEFFGGVPKDAARIGAILKETGLIVCGWHSGIDEFLGDNFEKTVAFHKAIGNTRVVVPGLPPEMTKDAAAWRETAKLFQQVALKLQAEGMTLGYHNHDSEVKPLDDGTCAWDIMAGAQDVVLQLDNGNAMSGGADSLALLKKYPGRSKTIHLKPYSKKDGFATMIGEDDIPWAETFEELERQGATEWAIIEFEDPKYDEFEGLRLCYERLKAIGKA
jgi:sugar phosphate isomerase/epimerase